RRRVAPNYGAPRADRRATWGRRHRHEGVKPLRLTDAFRVGALDDRGPGRRVDEDARVRPPGAGFGLAGHGRGLFGSDRRRRVQVVDQRAPALAEAGWWWERD